MGVILNWSSSYPGTVDTVGTNFPTLSDGVHDVLSSHVNSLATAIAALEVVVGGLRVAPIADPLTGLSDGDVLVWSAGDGEWVPGAGGVTSHASTHIKDGSDEISGDDLAVAFVPATYTPSDDILEGHLDGIDTYLADSLLDSDFSGTDTAFLVRTGANTYSTVKRNSTTVDPVVGDDNLDGYSIGSQWINTTSDEIFFCTDAATGAAVWVNAGGGAITAPLELADSAGQVLIELDGDSDGTVEFYGDGIIQTVGTLFTITGTPHAASPGDVVFIGGEHISGGVGGEATLRGGAGDTGGDVFVRGGSGNAWGGAVTVLGGEGSGSGGANAALQGGTGPSPGAAIIQGGHASTSSGGNGGNVLIEAGNADGAGTDGLIQVGTTSTSAINSGNSSVTWTHAGPFRANVPITTETTTSRTLTNSDKSSWIRCTNGSTVTITPNAATMSNGWTAMVEQAGAGQVVIDPGGGSLVYESTFLPQSRAQYAIIVLTCVDAGTGTFHVSGGLELA